MFKLVHKMKNRKGFTLIELIIVLAILGIIAAIAVPRFTQIQDKAKVKADNATCELIESAAEIAFVNGDIESCTKTAISDTDLIDDGYLDETPNVQSDSSKVFKITITDDGNATVLYE